MVKATKVTKTGKEAGKASRGTKTVKAPAKKPAVKKAPAKKLSKANLDEMFKAAVSSNESYQTTDDNYDKAIEHFNGIIRLLDAIIDIDPSYRNAVNYKGMMLYGCGRIADAIACFELILKNNPVDKEALNNKGICLYGLGKDEDGLKCVEAAIAVDKRYADAYMNKAIILTGLGRIEEADKAFRKARTLDIVVG
jgi:tetratricopeptide (TPR) repeat protein